MAHPVATVVALGPGSPRLEGRALGDISGRSLLVEDVVLERGRGRNGASETSSGTLGETVCG